MRVDREYLEAICDRLEADGIEVECVLAGGDPSKEIAAAAEREDCDLIAMSTHGHRFIKDVIYGSVANEVRHLSRVPVLLVRGDRKPPQAISRSKADMTASAALRDLTAPVEDYLKAIYELEAVGGVGGHQRDRRRAPDRRAVGERHDAPPGRAGAHHARAVRGVQLTREGRRAALRTIRRHRVIEAYLTQALGYPWDRVHDEAERLEHSASDELIDRMAAAIGEPETDPHGAPIPTRDGTLTAGAGAVELAELGEGDPARIARVSDRDGERLRYLATIGITIGTQVEVVSREPYDGPIALRIGTRRRVHRPRTGAAHSRRPARQALSASRLIASAHLAAGFVAGMTAARVTTNTKARVALAFGLGFLSHIALDAIPHSDYMTLPQSTIRWVVLGEIIGIFAVAGHIIRDRVQKGWRVVSRRRA